jgi:hypothetical protein
MQKAHVYEAIFLVNQGIDEAVRGLERLKRTKDLDLDPGVFDEKLTLFEANRASLNAYFCNNVEGCEDQDAAHFEKRHRPYEKEALDEVKVYEDVRAIEESRRKKGEVPMVRFLTEEDQEACERQYPTPTESSKDGETSIGSDDQS